MLIKNALVYSPTHSFEKKDLFIKKERIHTSFSETSEIIEAEGLYAIPGLTDTHIHGAMGFDFCDGSKKALFAISNYLAKNGITSFLPTSMTLPEARLKTIVETINDYDNPQGAMILGITMEGPFLSQEKKGAQNEQYLKMPSIEFFRNLNKASKNKIKLAAIAPELPGALDFIKALKDEVILSLAHTTANYDEASLAFKNGASHVTHLYNAMLPFNHREPGLVGAAFDEKKVKVELICDGIHSHPSVIRSSFQLFSDNRIVLISDGMSATGMPDGLYRLGGQKVTVLKNKALLDDGTIAGSSTNLMDCLRKAVAFGIPLESAIKAAAVNPIKLIGETENFGSLENGKYANIVLLDKKLNIKYVILKGKIITP